MSSVTLVEAAKLSQDKLVLGLAQSIVTVDQFYGVLPFHTIDGRALIINQEATLGDVQVSGVGDTITAKSPATFNDLTFKMTRILGDAEVDGLVQATHSDKQDQTAIQIASKAKSAGRQFSDMLINGTGLLNEFEGLDALMDSNQVIDVGTDGVSFDPKYLDEVADLVLAKDGQVDFYLMSRKMFRRLKGYARTLGGISPLDMIKLPNGMEAYAYENIPIFRSDYISDEQTQGAHDDCSTVYAGTLDDGSEKVGIFGFTPQKKAGLHVEYVGVHQSRDEQIHRVKWYVGLAAPTPLCLAACPGIRVGGW